MAELGYAERLAQQRAQGLADRTRIIVNAWNDYLIASTSALRAMPNHPDEIDVNHIIRCRGALAAASGCLDRIEEQLPVSRSMVDGRDR